jgi:long-chain acyl-CoA synthetase
MAHRFGKVLLTTQLAVGFPTAVDGRVERIVDNLAVIKPTFMGAAPRIFEKAYGRVVTMAHNEGGAKAKIFDWACAVGKQTAQLKLAGKPIVSGSAALSREVAEWFYAADILILEGYGLTETSAASFVNLPHQNRFGTVGHPVPGTQVKIADDGEVLIKGPGVMDGYHNLEDETAATLVGDGWLATGDIGEVEDGFLRITDRKKDLFKTSGGKYVAPSNIEGQFKAICPLASQMVVHGHERNFVTAIITLDPDAVTEWSKHHDMDGASYSEVVGSAAMQKAVDDYVDELNSRLNRWEQIKKYILLEHDLTIESGELTPSLKVKRRVVETNYRDRLDALYS